MKNNSQITEQNKINRLIFWGVCFILFLPIVVLPLNFQPSDWSRAILFRIILTVLISFLLFKYLYKKEIAISIPKWKTSSFLPLLILLAFSIVLILATIFSEDIRFSVFGSPVRAGGLLNWLSYLVFAVFIAVFIKERDWEKLLKIFFLVGTLASLLAFIQYFDLLKGIFISHVGGNTSSFLGNSTFLAIYMLFLSLLSFTLLTQEKNKKKKLIYAGLFCLFSFTILISGSRAGYLAFLIGFFYFFLFYPVKSNLDETGKKLRIAKIIAIALSILAILFIIYANMSPKLPNFIENNVRLSYLIHNRLSVKTISEDLFGTRLTAWKMTLEAIKDKPILGWGPENFYIGFEKYYDPTISNFQKLWWDRPHNIFLDVAVNSGIISLLLYLAFWITLFWRLQILKKDLENKFRCLAHGLQAMFAGYLIVLFFNFDSFSSYITSFFFIGYSFYLISEKEDRIIIPPPRKNIFQKKFIVIPSLIILAFFIWSWNIKPLYLNSAVTYAGDLANIGKCSKSLSMMKNLWKKSNILNAYTGLKYSDIVKKCALPENEVDYSKKAVEALSISAKIQPKFTRTWLFMGSFANVLAAREQDQDNKNKLLLEARSYFENALKLSPKRQEIIIEMEKNYLLAEDYKTMKTLAESCAKIDESNGKCYWYLGVAEIFLGDQENGKKHILESGEKGYTKPPFIQLGVAYMSQKNYKDAADTYDSMVFYEPENASYHATLALLLKQIGKYSEAAQEAVKVFKLQPENPEVRKFLEQLLGFSPNDPSLHASLAFIYKQLGEEKKARQELLIVKSLYLQLIAKYPRNHSYHFYLADVYRELKEYEKALKEAEIGLNLSPSLKEEFEEFRTVTQNEKYLNEKYEEKQRKQQK